MTIMVMPLLSSASRFGGANERGEQPLSATDNMRKQLPPARPNGDIREVGESEGNVD